VGDQLNFLLQLVCLGAQLFLYFGAAGSLCGSGAAFGCFGSEAGVCMCSCFTCICRPQDWFCPSFRGLFGALVFRIFAAPFSCILSFFLQVLIASCINSTRINLPFKKNKNWVHI